MQIVQSDTIDKLPFSVATIGCFDGVHRGHRFLIEQVCTEARKRGLNSMLITFPVHPRQVMQKSYQPELLSCPAEKESLLLQQQADYCLLLPFTQELSQYSAKQFMQLLHEQYHVRALVIGYDHRFGHNRSEGFTDYCRYGKELGMEIVQAKGLVEEGISISSSAIRRLLSEGQIEQANHFLGYNYSLEGTVTEGFKIGRKLGFPTANIQPACGDKLIPGNGVYAVRVHLDAHCYPAMLNIGYRPTVNNGNNLSIEAHILNYSGDIYHCPVRIEFISFIRKEAKFEDLTALSRQLEEDRKNVTRMFSSLSGVYASQQ